MKAFLTGLSALAVCASILMPAHGADEVAQPACFGWLHRDPPPPPRPSYSTAGFYAVAQVQQPCCPQPAPACPQTTCAQTYSLQSYYQAVTSYQTQTYYEPVTTYQTSQYYEPVTTMRTSCYYCPNSCQWKQVQVPETAYVLKTKSCPVQGYVAKSTQVPVVTYQKAYYYQPQTVCTQSPPPPAPCCQQPVVAQAPAPCCQQPNVAQSPAQPPSVTATPGPVPDFRAPPPIIDAPPQSKGPSNGSSWTPVQAPPQTAKAPVLSAPLPSGQPAQTVKLDRIVFGADAVVEGELVRGDKTPRPDVKILFVNANQSNLRETVTTNHAGRFQVTLASGGWLVYIHNVDGDAQFHSRIEVSDEQNTGKIILVNR